MILPVPSAAISASWLAARVPVSARRRGTRVLVTTLASTSNGAAASTLAAALAGEQAVLKLEAASASASAASEISVWRRETLVVMRGPNCTARASANQGGNLRT